MSEIKAAKIKEGATPEDEQAKAEAAQRKAEREAAEAEKAKASAEITKTLADNGMLGPPADPDPPAQLVDLQGIQRERNTGRDAVVTGQMIAEGIVKKFMNDDLSYHHANNALRHALRVLGMTWVKERDARKAKERAAEGDAA